MSRSPMPRDHRPSGIPFLKLASTRVYLTIASEVAWYTGHWVPGLRRSIRCSGDDCEGCRSGAESRVFAYVAVSLESGQVQLLELPRRCRDLTDQLYQAGPDIIGTRLCAWKDGQSANSPVMVLAIPGWEQTSSVDIWPLVASFGLPPIPLKDSVRHIA